VFSGSLTAGWLVLIAKSALTVGRIGTAPDAARASDVMTEVFRI